MEESRFTGAESRIQKVTFWGNNRAKLEWDQVIHFEDGSEVVAPQVTTHPLMMHSDTVEEIKKLKPHLGRLNGMAEKEWEKLQITGIRIDLGGDNPRGMIIGKYTTVDNQKLACNTPYLKLESTQYPFKSDLVDLLDEIEVQVRKYFYEGFVENPEIWTQMQPKLPKLSKVS